MFFNELRQLVATLPSRHPEASWSRPADRHLTDWLPHNASLGYCPSWHTHTHTQKHIINYCLTATVWSEEKERCLLSPQIPLIDFHSRLPIMHALCSGAAGEWSTCQLSVGKCLPPVDAAPCECSSAWGAITSRKGVSEKDIFHVLVRLNLQPSA